jgi:hypothetical protein
MGCLTLLGFLRRKGILADSAGGGVAVEDSADLDLSEDLMGYTSTVWGRRRSRSAQCPMQCNVGYG